MNFPFVLGSSTAQHVNVTDPKKKKREREKNLNSQAT